MKNLSTRVLAAAIGILAASFVAAQPVELARDAPDKHVVVRGDTLWSISGKFLQKPWRWPEVWQLNKEQIRNPHLIYPGDVVYLDSSGGTARLRLGKALDGAGAGPGQAPGAADAGNESSERRRPAIRVEPLAREAIPTLDGAAIDAFLNHPLIIDEKGLQTHPRVVATQDGRVFLGRGELAYVRGLPAGDLPREWFVYRPAKPLLDPDTRKPIAFEALYVGTVRLERAGDPASFRVLSAAEEIGPGDRLMPAERNRQLNYVPRPPDAPVAGRIISIYRGVSQAGRNSVVAINLGTSQGLAIGHVLAIEQRGRLVPDRETKQLVQLPAEPIGHLLLFRVFDKIAYGLIMDTSQSVALGDDVRNP